MNLQNYMLTQATSINIVELKQWPCPFLDNKYVLLEEIGHGTYGSVYKAQRKSDDKFSALKKMQNFQDKNQMGFPITTLRQIKLLQGLNHPNILNITQVVFEKSKNKGPPTIYICLDLMDCDLAEYIKFKTTPLSSSVIQTILRQILTGLNYLHQNKIAHRDIKPSNILVNQDSEIKIADFGLAKKLGKYSTTKVVTLWYRAPQLLLGIRKYSTKVDIWSVGCLAAQLLLKRPLFQHQTNETQMIIKMFELMGTPNECGWQQQLNQQSKIYQTEIKSMINFSCPSSIIYHLKKTASQYEMQYQLMDLIQKMLRLNHHSRLSASQCLQHSYFSLQYPEQKILGSQYFERRKSQAGELTKKVKKY